MSTTDHKVIGKLYLGTSFLFFLLAGIMAMVIRAELLSPGTQIVSLDTYWLFLFGGLIVVSGFFRRVRRRALRLVRLQPAVRPDLQPQHRQRPVDHGLSLIGLGAILASVNFITTIICMRASGMTMSRLSIFVWNVLLTSLLVLMAFPRAGRGAAGAGGRPHAGHPGLRCSRLGAGPAGARMDPYCGNDDKGGFVREWTAFVIRRFDILPYRN
ncbi:cbb3-type cytochrome c oxidase subunit I [Nonomuraea insulae]|uniref:Cbb3-type cytochrome c oxidase subunit I n=1 Tax=Nonomuraea insulae TaxID=1616787 RepID=A0ABW1CMC4_9ACTN